MDFAAKTKTAIIHDNIFGLFIVYIMDEGGGGGGGKGGWNGTGDR